MFLVVYWVCIVGATTNILWGVMNYYFTGLLIIAMVLLALCGGPPNY